MKNYSAVGKDIPRTDGVDKVTGRAKFSDDVKLPGMLYGKVLRSPHPHAKISSIDTRRARDLPGVRAVVTGEDAPDIRYGLVAFSLLCDRHILAKDKVRFVGESVAAVAALSPEIAEEAIDLIQVQYEPLPALHDPEKAMKSDAPLIHEDINSYSPEGGSGREGNILFSQEFENGDVAAAFEKSDLIFDDTFHTPVVHQCYLEPNSATADVDHQGKVTAWVTTQGSFGARDLLAYMFNLPNDKVNVVPTEIGGGFGGKLGITIAPISVMLAKKAGKPVKVTMTREEEFLNSMPRYASVIQIKTGARSDGTLLARQVKVIIDAGAYASFSPAVAMSAAMGSGGPYNIPNLKAAAFSVYTNKTPGGAYRAPGVPQMAFAYESQMDIIAHKIGMDPLELRRKNGLKKGDSTFDGRELEKSTFKTVLEKAAEGIQWGGKPKGANRGKGLGCGQWTTGMNPGGGLMKLNEDGTISIISGMVDLTGSRTILAQIAAEELGLPIDHINVITVDTDTALPAPLSGGSTITYNMGNAIRLASGNVKKKLLKLAAEKLGEKEEDLEVKGGAVKVIDSSEKSLSLAELSRISSESKGEPIIGAGLTHDLPSCLTFVAHAAEVEVDPETGVVTVLDYSACQDVGFAINPMSVQGQIQGGVVQGIGMGLTEEYIFDGDGKILNPSFLDYRIPTSADVPKIKTFIVEEASPKGPYGAKGVGEPPHVPPTPAIANAIYDAVGVRVKEFPITPEKIRMALKEKLGN